MKNPYIQVTQVTDNYPDIAGIVFLDHVIGVMDCSKIVGQLGVPENARSAITINREAAEIVYLKETLADLIALINRVTS